jgi:hypothetical protein
MHMPDFTSSQRNGHATVIGLVASGKDVGNTRRMYCAPVDVDITHQVHTPTSRTTFRLGSVQRKRDIDVNSACVWGFT